MPIPKTDPIDVLKEITDVKIKEALAKAQHGAKKLTDNEDDRADLGDQAQQLLMALRELGVGYNARAVSLAASAGGAAPKGDLYIYGKPCHPRDAGAILAAGDNVADLTDLVAELKSKLDYEAS